MKKSIIMSVSRCLLLTIVSVTIQIPTVVSQNVSFIRDKFKLVELNLEPSWTFFRNDYLLGLQPVQNFNFKNDNFKKKLNLNSF